MPGNLGRLHCLCQRQPKCQAAKLHVVCQRGFNRPKATDLVMSQHCLVCRQWRMFITPRRQHSVVDCVRFSCSAACRSLSDQPMYREDNIGSPRQEMPVNDDALTVFYVTHVTMALERKLPRPPVALFRPTVWPSPRATAHLHTGR